MKFTDSKLLNSDKHEGTTDSRLCIARLLDNRASVKKKGYLKIQNTYLVKYLNCS